MPTIPLTMDMLPKGLTTKITRLPPSDFDFRKRPIGNSGAFFCSSPFCHGDMFTINGW
jgi:hypothetical protein